MKYILLLLTLAGALIAQPPPTFVANQVLAASSLNTGFQGLYSGKIGRWSGSGAPGDFPFSLIGDLYFDTSSQGTVYACYKIHCTAVGASNWVLTSAAGTVTSVGVSRTNDTNVTMTVTNSPITTNGTINLALGWTGTLAAARLVNSGVFTGDATSTFPALTLNTVNSNVGTFGDSTHVGQFTVNGKGLITAASSVAISGVGAGCNPAGSANDVLVDNGAGGCTASGVTIDPTAGAGAWAMPQGAARTIPDNNVGFQAPTSVTSGFYFTLPGAPAAGLFHATNTTPSVVSVSAVTPSDLSSVQGNGAKVQLSTGSTTTGHCVQFDANGNSVDAGAPCGTGSSSFSVSGWYLTDGAGNYYSGPHHAPMTLPNAGSFSWLTTQGGATETANGNALILTAPPNGGGDAIRARGMSIGANTTLTAHFAYDAKYTNYGHGGIGFRESGTGKIVTFNISLDPAVSQRIAIEYFTNATTYSGSQPYSATNLGAKAIWVAMRIVYTTGAPGTLDFYLSNDDTTWELALTTNANAFFTTAPDQWFYSANTSTANTSASVTLYSWKTE